MCKIMQYTEIFADRLTDRLTDKPTDMQTNHSTPLWEFALMCAWGSNLKIIKYAIHCPWAINSHLLHIGNNELLYSSQGCHSILAEPRMAGKFSACFFCLFLNC